MLRAEVITTMRSKALKLAIAGAIAFLIGLLSTIRSAPAQEPERFDMKVRTDFFAGFTGDKEALGRGMKACEDMLAVNPKHAQALVWHGGGVLYQASGAFQTGDQTKSRELWARGLQEMQTAVDLDPGNVAVRIPRGAVLLTATRYMPTLDMARPLIEKGLSDYERTYELQKPFFQNLGTHPRGELLFGLAEGYSRLGDAEKARGYFEQIRDELPDTAYARRANLWMETRSLPLNQTGCVGCHAGK